MAIEDGMILGRAFAPAPGAGDSKWWPGMMAASARQRLRAARSLPVLPVAMPQTPG